MISHVCIIRALLPGHSPPQQHRKLRCQYGKCTTIQECGTQGGMVPVVSISQANLIPSYGLSYSAWISPPGKGTGRTSDPHRGVSCHSPGLCLHNSSPSEHWSDLSSLAHHPGQLQGDDEPGSLGYLGSGHTSQENSCLGKRQ